MSNHYHVVVHLRPDISEAWTDKEVIQRWHSLFKGTLLSQQFLDGESLSEAKINALKKDIKCWRQRLCDLSWFMRIVNEYIARKANSEDECTGRFWEGRFKSQALLDEKALLSCMAYVDLNPIRAKMAKTPERSDHTSVKLRIESIQKEKRLRNCVARFVGNHQEKIGVPFYTKDYIQLVDWTGRQIRRGKRGAINSKLPPIIDRLGIDEHAWHILTTQFESQFKQWVGAEHIVKKLYKAHQYQRIPSTRAFQALLG